MSAYSLFSVFGIEIEYMIVDKVYLNIQPIADELIKSIAGSYTNEIERNDIAINNELALHVVELKTNGPKPTLNGMDKLFQAEINDLNRRLSHFNACLMPGGAHPWMDPMQGVKLWPHGNRSIYERYDRIFDCRGHGWSNLQSIHINLPFASDEEFSRLHNAIRLLLPVIPALCASTPFIEGKKGDALCMRLMHYGKNQSKIPQISGDVIPEFVSSKIEYIDTILNPMYRAISPFDKEGLLQEEWLNSRGAIARFERDAMEIRVVDSQESALADLSIVSAISKVLEYIVNETDAYLMQPIDSQVLKKIYDAVVREGFTVSSLPTAFVDQFGVGAAQTVHTLWEKLLNHSLQDVEHDYQAVLEDRLSHGNLSQRLIKAVGKPVSHQKLKHVYTLLSDCLNQNMIFNHEKINHYV